MIPLFKTPEEYTLFWTKKLAERANRLVRLTELNGPEIILQNERRLVAEALQRLPADVNCLMEWGNVEEENSRERNEFLNRAGYFKEIGERGAGGPLDEPKAP